MGMAAQRAAANPITSAEFNDLAQWQSTIVDFEFEFILLAFDREWHLTVPPLNIL
jgi:hypothetical protein